jgi:hypothetical protein
MTMDRADPAGPDRELVDGRWAENFLGYCSKTLMTWAREGRHGFPMFTKIGRSVRWSRRDLVHWAERYQGQRAE